MAIDMKRLRSIVGGSAGNLVEWYDWFAFATFAIYFAPAFFPKGDMTAQLLCAVGRACAHGVARGRCGCAIPGLPASQRPADG